MGGWWSSVPKDAWLQNHWRTLLLAWLLKQHFVSCTQAQWHSTMSSSDGCADMVQYDRKQLRLDMQQRACGILGVISAESAPAAS